MLFHREASGSYSEATPNSPSALGSMPTAVVVGCNSISQASATLPFLASPIRVYKEHSSTLATAALGSPDSTAGAALPWHFNATVQACQSMVGLVSCNQSTPNTTSWLRSGKTRHYTLNPTALHLLVHATKGTWHRVDEETRLPSANVTYMPSSLVTGSWYSSTNF